MVSFILFLLLSAFLILFAALGFRIVQQAETIVVERLGSYHRTLDSGVNFIIPLLDQPRQVEWRYTVTDVDGRMIVRKEKIIRIDLRETVYDFPKQSVITKDNAIIEINAVIYFQITEPYKVVYEIANLPDALEKLVQTTLRNSIGDMNFDAILGSRDQINKTLKVTLDEATHKWGVKINRVELQDIQPPHGIQHAMELQMTAEREKRAAITRAEGIQSSEILAAEGKKRALITVSEGEAKARISVAEAESEAIKKIADAAKETQGDAIKYLIAVRYLDTLGGMLQGESNKLIVVPYEATGVLGALGGIKELLDGTPIKTK